MVTDYLKEHKEINISKTIKLLNLSKSRSNDVLKIMQKSGIIIREGSARATKYVLNKKLQ
jgi:predicted transcriptional regulator